MNLVTSSALEIAGLVSQRKVSAVEVAAEVVAHVQQLNPELNALIRFDPAGVFAEAARVDQRLAEGEAIALAGVLFSVKDNLWIEGKTCSQGSRLFADFVAPTDAIAVERARVAGGVVLGTSNCSEFACKGLTTNLLFGPTRNPWRTDLTPGGSSGGAAAAVAAGLGHVAICTDGGGSTRRPASHAGVVGFKPSAGAIAHVGGFAEPVFGNSVIGLMGRTVADVSAVFESIRGGHPGDPQFPAPEIGEPWSGSGNRSSKPLRVAFSPKLGLDVPVDSAVAEAVKQSALLLAQEGVEVEQEDPPWPPGTSEEVLMPLQLAGLAALYGEQFRQDNSVFDPDIAAQIERGLSLDGKDVARALMHRDLMFSALSRFFQKYDLLYSPTTPCVAWPLDQLGPRTIGGQPTSARAHAVFTPAINHVYAPACSVPIAVDAQRLPIGGQVIGWRGRDALVLRLARQVEAAAPAFFQRPVSVSHPPVSANRFS